MSFERDISKFDKLSEVALEKTVRSIAWSVYKSVKKKTPVKTGLAKNNWNLSPGKIDSSVTDKLTKIEPTLKKGDGKKPIFITNSLHYIQYLEYGPRSPQAPKGMVHITMAEFEGLSSIFLIK